MLEFNEDLEDSPELINSSPYDEGWIIKSTISDDTDLAVYFLEEYKNLIS